MAVSYGLPVVYDGVAEGLWAEGLGKCEKFGIRRCDDLKMGKHGKHYHYENTAKMAVNQS